ncbi:MAG TPA: hypothetical protein VGV37_28890 [Aliidongia sp.]|uniref:hypothetical protein n=1 Tax=Aliidongia sp. TaxID=1914230 RepID=UPI002DDDA819|nr:hypothetical protein [Aliidongia sp.]HEV2678578.1 hypothetical protein [Aliidongia sp.]
MDRSSIERRDLLVGADALAAVLAAMPFHRAAAALPGGDLPKTKENSMSTTFTKTATPDWLLAMWKEIDDKTWGKGFDCFAEDAECHLGVADWKGREVIRENLRNFVDRQMTTHHDVIEYWDGGSLKIFRGFVSMKFDDASIATVKPVMTHFFYMDDKDPTKVARWFGSVGPTGF